MTTTPTTPPRAMRSSDDRLLAGVCGGLAEHLGIPAIWLRVGFVISTLLGGFGVLLYAALWLVMPQRKNSVRGAPGLEAASRHGKRPRPQRRFQDAGVLVPIAAVLLGLLIILNRLGGGWVLFWPLVAGVMGLAVIWLQADEAQRERWASPESPLGPLTVIFGARGAGAATRVAAGVVLILLSLTLLAVQTGQFRLAMDVIVAGIVGIVGVALVVGPWLLLLASDLTEERAERIRSQERADVAAHLHDSVLQTLALIQSQSEDSRAVARLARAQERDLRRWLYDDVRPDAATLSAALKEAAAEVEDLHGARIDVVTVGDVPFDDRTSPVVLAAREAMTNSAKHSGAAQVDVYCEVSGRSVSVFVRDRGRGFDRSEVPDGRMGLRHSIEERMSRHGGDAEVRTAEGEGTEVRLTMELEG